MKNKTITTLLIASTLLLSGCCLKHEFSDANCTQPQTCVKCGETQGESLGHNFQEATCTEAKQCSICNVTEGEPLGHNFSEPTCTEASKCLACNITQGQPLGHDFKEADYEKPKTCQLCGLTEGEPLPAVTVELGEDDYKGDDPFDTGDVDFEGMTQQDKVQQIISDYIKKNTQQQGNWELPPGATPYDPSKDGKDAKDYSDTSDIPAHLRGDVIN